MNSHEIRSMRRSIALAYADTRRHWKDEDRWCRACHKMLPHRYRPSPEAGPFWRCSECGEAEERKSIRSMQRSRRETESGE